jgi:hypothetical protein
MIARGPEHGVTALCSCERQTIPGLSPRVAGARARHERARARRARHGRAVREHSQGDDSFRAAAEDRRCLVARALAQAPATSSSAGHHRRRSQADERSRVAVTSAPGTAASIAGDHDVVGRQLVCHTFEDVGCGVPWSTRILTAPHGETGHRRERAS